MPVHSRSPTVVWLPAVLAGLLLLQLALAVGAAAGGDVGHAQAYTVGGVSGRVTATSGGDLCFAIGDGSANPFAVGWPYWNCRPCSELRASRSLFILAAVALVLASACLGVTTLLPRYVGLPFQCIAVKKAAAVALLVLLLVITTPLVVAGFALRLQVIRGGDRVCTAAHPPGWTSSQRWPVLLSGPAAKFAYALFGFLWVGLVVLCGFFAATEVCAGEFEARRRRRVIRASSRYAAGDDDDDVGGGVVAPGDAVPISYQGPVPHAAADAIYDDDGVAY